MINYQEILESIECPLCFRKKLLYKPTCLHCWIENNLDKLGEKEIIIFLADKIKSRMVH